MRYPKREMISSLYQRNYRLFFFGQLISVAGTWMQTVAQSFLVLDLTHSGTQLGLTTAARFAPMLVFGPVGGLFADRMNKRRVLYVTQAASGLLAGAFAVLTATHDMRLWVIYLLAVALGFVNVFDNPARQSFISEMVSAGNLPNAVTLNSVSMNMARVFGAAAGGAIAAALDWPVLRLQRGLVRRRADLAGGDARVRPVPGPGGSSGSGVRSGRDFATFAPPPSCSSRC